MSDIITDIKLVRIKTDYAFALSECKTAYEEAGRDVDKAVESLKAKIVPGEVEEMTESEKADWEKYKREAEKRADKKSKQSSPKRKYAIVMRVFSLIFLVAFVAVVIAAICEPSSAGFATILAVISAIMAIALFAISVAVPKMDDKEFSEATSHTNAESIVYLHYDNEAIQCPHCSSTNILLKEKKFSKSKAFIGMTAFGIKGALLGIPNHKRVKCRCADCGHEFEAVRR